MRTCPHCGRVVTDTDVQTCPTCGLSLATEQSAPQQAEPVPVYAAPPAFSVPPTQQPTNQPPYTPAYGAPTNYPGAYRPGVDWQPSNQPKRRPWGRITAGVVVALVVIAIVVSVYNQSHAKPIEPISPASANATVTAAIAASNTLLSDPLTSNVNGWSNDSHCYFAQDGYHIGGGYICYAPIDNQVDGVETVTASQVAGPDNYAYGLIFRLEDDNNYYEFAIDSNSRWAFFKVVNGKTTRLHDYTTNVAINGGLNTKNTLSVKMSGSTFEFYVNGQKMGTMNDATLPEGKWGLAADNGLNVVFTNYLAKSA